MEFPEKKLTRGYYVRFLMPCLVRCFPAWPVGHWLRTQDNFRIDQRSGGHERVGS